MVISIHRLALHSATTAKAPIHCVLLDIQQKSEFHMRKYSETNQALSLLIMAA